VISEVSYGPAAILPFILIILNR